MRFVLRSALLLGLACAGCSSPAATGAGAAQPNASSPAAAADAATPSSFSVVKSRGTIATLGDTVTLGIANTSAATTFPAQLGALAHMNVVNLGTRNVLTADVTRREVPQIPRNADAVVLDVGTIDASAASTNADPATAAKNVKLFEPNFDKLIDAVRGRVPRAKIVVVTVRDLGRAGVGNAKYRGPSLSAAVHEWDAHERAYAAGHGIRTVVDTETDPQWYVAADYDRGGIHPTDAGALRLARAIAPLLGA